MNDIIQRIRRKISKKIIIFFIDNRIKNRHLLRVGCWLYVIIEKFGKDTTKYQKRKHHFVPRFLLKRFKIDNTGLIYQYKRGEKKIRKCSIKKQVACEEDYYSYKIKGRNSLSIFIETEIFADLIEDYVPAMLDRLDKGDTIDLVGVERSIFAHFIVYQYTRTPAFRAQIENFLLYLILIKGIDKKNFENERFRKEVLVQNSLEITKEELWEFSLFNKTNNRFRLSGANNFLIFIPIDIGNYISKDIFYKNIHILEIEDDKHFVLSDNPVTVTDLSNPSVLWPMGWDLKGDDIMIFIPISKKRCIFLCNQKKKDGPIDKNSDMIKLVINNTYYYSHHCIYYSEEDDSIRNCLNSMPELYNYK